MTKFLISRRRLIKVGAASTVLAGLAPAIISREVAAQEKVVYVNTWGGGFTEAEENAFYKPFTAATGIPVKAVTPVSFAKLKAQVQTGQYDWDITTFGSVELAQGMAEGLYEPVDTSIIKAENFGPGQVLPYAVGSQGLSTLLCYRKDKFPNGGPQSWADFWDVKKFPGNRALYNQSYTIVAYALLADGVPKDKLYPMDLDRAFKKLNEIKPHIKVWWTQGNQSQQIIKDGEVDMLPLWNARAQELVDAGAPIQMVWNEAQFQDVYWEVAKGTPRAKLAWEFIAFAAQGKPQAEFAKRMPYGPTNPKAFDFLSKAEADKLPTAPDHLKVAFKPDAEWLGKNLDSLKERFAQWLAG